MSGKTKESTDARFRSAHLLIQLNKTGFFLSERLAKLQALLLITNIAGKCFENFSDC